MAKLFYSIEEVCEKLGKSEDEVREMVSSGQLQEFRDRDKLMFKVEQVDLMAGGGDDDDGELSLGLEDTSGGSGLGMSGSGLALADTGDATGVSVFETEHGDEDKKDGPSGGSGDVSLESAGGSMGLGLEDSSTGSASGESFGDDLELEAVGSGSGLLDLTQESDDTTLGAELLEQVYSGDEEVDIPSNASGLFDAAQIQPTDEAPAVSEMAMPVVVEAYDGAGSGLGVGMMVGAAAAMVVLALVIVVTMLGTTSQLAMMIADNLWIWTGGLAGGTLILGAIGFVIGKATE